jgi:hypothetical protein
MIFKAVEWQDASGVPEHDYEEVPQEDLWEDGELRLRDVEQKILLHVLDEGDWILVREVYNGED